MTSELVTVRHLGRKAVIYIRQSTPQQVLSNQESLRLQYALRQRAQDLGWHEADIEVIVTFTKLSGTVRYTAPELMGATPATCTNRWPSRQRASEGR